MASYSLTFGYIESPILEPVRKVVETYLGRIDKKFIQLTWCYHCAGFWLSLVVALTMYSEEPPIMYVVLALASSGVILVIQYWMTNTLLRNKKLDMESEDVSD